MTTISTDTTARGRVWRWLVEPAASVKDLTRRRRARLLSSLLLLMMAVTVLGVFSRGQQALDLAVAGIVLVVAYTLSRTRHYQMAGVLAVVTLSGPSFYSLITASDYGFRDVTISLMWVAIPVLLASLIFAPRGTLIVMLANAAGIVLLWLLIPTLTLTALLLPIGFLLAIFVLTYFITSVYVRDMQQVERRAGLLSATTEVSQSAATAPSLEELLDQTVDHISERFGYYHVQIFLVDAQAGMALLRASTGEVGRLLLARKHRLPVGSLSVIGQVTARGEPVIASDVGVDPVHRRNELLPNTRSEMALPMRAGERIIGALDVQSTAADAFSPEDVSTLQILANQLAASIENARLLDEVMLRAGDNERLLKEAQENLSQIEALNRSLTREGWRDYLSSRKRLGTQGYTLQRGQVARDAIWTTGMQAAFDEQRAVLRTGEAGRETISLPLRVRGEPVGVVEIERQAGIAWADADVELAEALADRLALALDNARLLEQADTLARREQLVNEITQNVQQAESVDQILQSALVELGRVLGASKGVVQLGPKAQPQAGADSGAAQGKSPLSVSADSAVSEEDLT